MKRAYVAGIIAVFSISVFVFLVFLPVFISGKVLITGDNFDLIFPQKQFLVDEIKSNRFPLWNPYILSGTPYLADINLGTLSPLNSIYFLTSSIEKAGTYLLILQVFITALTIYVLCRYYKISKVGSVLASLIFVFSGNMLSYFTNLAIVSVVVFIPLLILLAEKFINRKRLSTLLVLGYFYGMQILSGHVQITYYTAFAITSLIFLYDKSTLLKKAIYIIIFLAVAVSIAAFQLLPFLEFVYFTPRFNQGFNWVIQGQLSYIDLIKFIIPKSLWSVTGWVDFSSKQTVGYIGVVPFTLFLIGVFKASKRFIFWSVIAFISILIALGANTPLYLLLYKTVPFFSSFRVPSQSLIFFSFSASLLAGYGFDKVVQFKSRISHSIVKRILFISGLVFILLIAAFYFLISERNILSELFSYVSSFGSFLSKNPYKYVVTLLNTYLIFIFLTIFIIGLLLMILSKRIIGITLIIVTILVDIFLSTQASIVTGDIDRIKSENTITELNSNKYAYKIYTVPPIQKPDTNIFLPTIEELFAKEKKGLLLPNHNIPEKFHALDGYASMALSKYIDRFANSGQTITGLGAFKLTSSQLFENGVKYVISKFPVNSVNGLKLVTDKQYYIYEVIDSKPRVFIDGQNSRIVSQKELPGVLSVTTFSSAESNLIYLDAMYPGWSVYVDGNRASIDLYNMVYKSVAIPKGTHVVEFIYKPNLPFIGMIISVISILLVFYISYRFKEKSV